MAKPLLTYDIKTNPTPVQVTQGVTISLVVSNSTNNFVSLSEIQFRLPAQGPNATDLSTNQAQVPTSSGQDGWTITQSGSVFSITPNNTASGTVTPTRIGGEGLIFNFGPIPVNDTPGTTTLKVAEDTGTQLSDPLAFDISKWPVAFKLSNFRALHSSVQPGATAQLLWDVEGDATLSIEYQSINVSNPPNPFTSQGLGRTTVFTLTADSSINGAPVTVAVQTSVEVTVPQILSSFSTYDIVYMGQGNSLHWTTQQTDYCVLKANGVVIDQKAPSSTGTEGFPVAANIMKSTTTFELDPVSSTTTGERKNWPAFAKTWLLKSPFSPQPGWGQVTVQQQGQTAYICNVRTNALDIVPMNTGQVEVSIPVGLGPRGVCLSTDGTTAYVSNAFDDTVSIVDLVAHRVTGSIAVPSPAGSAVLGGTAFVASIDPAGAAIATLNLETGTNAGNIKVVGRPFDVAINPDGQSLYVANNAGTTVDIYDVATAQKTGSVDVKVAPTTVASSGNGASIYAGSRLGTDIAVINSHIDTPALTTTLPAFLNPAAIGVSASGQFMAAVGPTGFFVFELSLPTGVSALETESDAEIEER
ncbi:MAG: YncE family protein [Sulfitobacter sp.]